MSSSVSASRRTRRIVGCRSLCLGVVVGMVAAAATFAAPAHAGTIIGGDSSGWVFTAASGETNDIVVSQQPGFSFSLTDSTANPIAIGAFGCQYPGAFGVQYIVYCSGVGNTITFNLGNENDSVRLFVGLRAIANGGDGNDTLGSPTTVGGVSANDTLNGGNGDDALFGGAGNDTFDGGSGSDGLFGGAGNDTLQGGAGPDEYFGGPDNDLLLPLYDPDEFSGGSGFDTIDYTGWESVDTSCFPDSCPIGVDVSFDNVANDGNYDLDLDHFTGNADNVGDNVEAAIGTSLPDAMNGGALERDQTFTGAGGDDTIGGGPGQDTVAGSGDADWTLSDSTLAGAGTDSLGSIEAGTLTGGNAANVIDASAFSGPAGLNGGSANDTLIVGPGDNAVDGGPNSDTLVATADATHSSLTLGAGNLTGLGTDALSNVEAATLHGNPSNNTLDAAASALPVTLDGGAGIDILSGGSGADTLTGGADDDTLSGGAGSDLIHGGDGADQIDGGTESDAHSSGTTFANRDLCEFTTFTTPGGLYGDAGADHIVGGAGTDRVDGGPGNDHLSGGGGADIPGSGSAADTCGPGGTIPAEACCGSGTDGGLYGGDDADELHGGDDRDRLEGGNGDDELFGEGGGDRGDSTIAAPATVQFPGGLLGGPGGDFLQGGLGPDDLAGGDGTRDEVSYADHTYGVEADIGVGTEDDGSLEDADLGKHDEIAADVEDLTGGPAGDVLTGDDDPNALSGSGGNDSLTGNGGSDMLTGGSETDAFDAGGGPDSIFSNDGVAENVF